MPKFRDEKSVTEVTGGIASGWVSLARVCRWDVFDAARLSLAVHCFDSTRLSRRRDIP